MDLGQVYEDVLPVSHYRALGDAMILLMEQSMRDLARTFDSGWSPDDWSLTPLLPERFRDCYTGEFARKFSLCLNTVIWKLAQPLMMRASCTAEELAASVLFETAETLLHEDHAEADFGLVEDMFFEDREVEMLYSADCIVEDDPPPTPEKGCRVANLHFEDWFRPYGPGAGSAYTSVHPYVWLDHWAPESALSVIASVVLGMNAKL